MNRLPVVPCGYHSPSQLPVTGRLVATLPYLNQVVEPSSARRQKRCRLGR